MSVELARAGLPLDPLTDKRFWGLFELEEETEIVLLPWERRGENRVLTDLKPNECHSCLNAPSFMTGTSRLPRVFQRFFHTERCKMTGSE